MKRLLELEPSDNELAEPALREARRMLSAVRPVEVSLARLERVRSRIDAAPTQPVVRVLPRPLFALAAAAVFIGGAAFALLAGGPWSNARPAASTAVSSPSPMASSPALRAPNVSASSGTEPLAAERARGAAVPTASASQPPAASSAVAEWRAPAHGPTPTVESPTANDVARIHAAAKALRSERDPARAAQLLEGVRGGPLAEEVLALRLEAAVARHDGSAQALARRYLAAYPKGRYRALASSALSTR